MSGPPASHLRRTARGSRPGRAFVHFGLLWCISATLASSQTVRPGGAPEWPHLAEVGALLGEQDAEVAVAGLVELGPNAAPAAWAILSGQALLDVDLDHATARARLHDALRQWSGPATTLQLIAAPDEHTLLQERLVLIELIGLTECAEAVEGVFDVLQQCDLAYASSNRVIDAVTAALRPLLLADPKRLRQLTRRMESAPDELLPFAIAAVTGDARPEAVDVLCRLAARQPELQSSVLSAIIDVATRLAPGQAVRCAAMTRSNLNDQDVQLVRLATRALGLLHDAESFVSIVALIEHDDAVVRAVAQDALHRLSGSQWRWEAEEWHRWRDSELIWHANAARHSDALAGDDLFVARQSLLETSRHRLQVEDTIEILSHGLDSDHPEIRLGAVLALGRLGRTRAVAHLIEMLNDSEGDIASEARRALSTLTGLDLGESSASWTDWWTAMQ